jgi:hypothetical protein
LSMHSTATRVGLFNQPPEAPVFEHRARETSRHRPFYRERDDLVAGAVEQFDEPAA